MARSGHGDLPVIVAPRPARNARRRILLRGYSGFAREALMAWCEANRVDFLFGLARNQRLEQAIKAELMEAVAEFPRSSAGCSWPALRRVLHF